MALVLPAARRLGMLVSSVFLSPCKDIHHSCSPGSIALLLFADSWDHLNPMPRIKDPDPIAKCAGMIQDI
jgi:hypothetical protein